MLFVLEVESLHLFTGSARGAPEVRFKFSHGAHVQYGRRDDGSAREKGATPFRREELAGFAVENVELQEVVWQQIVGNRVPCIEPLAVRYVTVAENLAQHRRVVIRPAL